MRTTVDLPEPLLRNAKRRAAERGVSLSVVVGDALRGHLAARRTPQDTPFQLYTVRGRLVNPDIDLARTSELLAWDDEAAFKPRQD
jgi:hypothetical protein